MYQQSLFTKKAVNQKIKQEPEDEDSMQGSSKNFEAIKKDVADKLVDKSGGQLTWANLDTADDNQPAINEDWLSKSIKKNVTDWRKLVDQKDSKKDLLANPNGDATEEFLAIEKSL